MKGRHRQDRAAYYPFPPKQARVPGGAPGNQTGAVCIITEGLVLWVRILYLKIESLRRVFALSNFGKLILGFRQFPDNIHNFANIGAFTLLLAGVENSLLEAKAGAGFGSGHLRGKNRTGI